MKVKLRLGRPQLFFVLDYLPRFFNEDPSAKGHARATFKTGLSSENYHTIIGRIVESDNYRSQVAGIPVSHYHNMKHVVECCYPRNEDQAREVHYKLAEIVDKGKIDPVF
jgi:hypothetical protein